MANVAELAIQLTAKIDGFKSGLNQGAASVQRFAKQVEATSKRTANLVPPRSISNLGLLSSMMRQAVTRTLAFGASVAAMAGAYVGLRAVTRAVRDQMEFIDSVAKTSDQLGIQTEALTAFTYAAKFAGLSSDELNKGLGQMVRRVSDAAQGTGTAVSALAEMGINAKLLAQVPVHEQFLQIADSMRQFANAGDRVRLSYDLFGRGGIKMLNILDSGRDGLIEMAREADNLGATFTRIDAGQVEIANDAIERMHELFRGTAKTLAIQLSPMIEWASKSITDWASSGEGATAKVLKGIEKVSMGFAHFIDASQQAQESLKKLGGLIPGFGGKTKSAGPGLLDWVSMMWPGLFAVRGLVNKTTAAIAKTPIQDRYSTKVTKFFEELRNKQRGIAEQVTAESAVRARLNSQVSDYAELLERAKERAKALADAVKLTFRQGPIQTIAINTALNRAMYNQQLRAGRLEKMEVGGRDLEMIGRGVYETNRLLRDGISLKAG